MGFGWGSVVWSDKEQRLARAHKGQLGVVRVTAPHDECNEHESTQGEARMDGPQINEKQHHQRKAHTCARVDDAVQCRAKWSERIATDDQHSGQNRQNVLWKDVIIQVLHLSSAGEGRGMNTKVRNMGSRIGTTRTGPYIKLPFIRGSLGD